MIVDYSVQTMSVTLPIAMDSDIGILLQSARDAVKHISDGGELLDRALAGVALDVIVERLKSVIDTGTI